MGYEDANGLHVDRDARRHAESMSIDDVRRRVQDLQDEVAHADERLRVLARERPFFVVGLAVAAGFLLGRAFGRS